MEDPKGDFAAPLGGGYYLNFKKREHKDVEDLLDNYAGNTGGSARQWAETLKRHKSVARHDSTPMRGRPRLLGVIPLVVSLQMAKEHGPKWLQDKKLLSSILGTFGVEKSDPSTVSFSGAGIHPSPSASTSISRPEPGLISSVI